MQKFFRGHRVKIDDEMPQFMDHFESGKEAIVQYSYLLMVAVMRVKKYFKVTKITNQLVQPTQNNLGG